MSGSLLTSQTPRLKPSKNNANQRLILIVEDHADTRELLKIVMHSFGYETIEATDGEEAVALAERLTPDLILMDTGLPQLDGVTATKRIRDLEAVRQVKIVFMSGHAFPEEREKALAAGGDEYFVKPINFGELELALKRILALPTSIEH